MRVVAVGGEPGAVGGERALLIAGQHLQAAVGVGVGAGVEVGEDVGVGLGAAAVAGARAIPLTVVPAGAVYNVTLLAVTILIAELYPAVSESLITLFAAVAPLPPLTYNEAPPPLPAAANPNPPKVVV